MVPIHAYPVLDRKKLRAVFPKVIDFGIQELGTRKVYVKILFYNLEISY